jgi:hypothetical protein
MTKNELPPSIASEKDDWGFSAEALRKRNLAEEKRERTRQRLSKIIKPGDLKLK